MRFGSAKFKKMHLLPGLHPGLCRPLAKSFAEENKKSWKESGEKELRKRKGRKSWCDWGGEGCFMPLRGEGPVIYTVQ